MTQVEVVIISGFLGSGKTTLLQNLLTDEKASGRKVAVLMNELGEKSIDTEIIGDKVPLQELLNGCICCTAKDDLEISLLTLFHMHQPDVIYIEASGVAHPIEILDACLSPVIADRISIRSIISTVDAYRWLQRNSQSPQLKRLYEEQVKHGDTLIINKTNQLSKNELQQITTELKSFNPDATLFMTNFSQVPLSDIPYSNRTSICEFEKVNVQQHLHIQAITYTFTNEIKKNDFEKWLMKLPDTIHRIKGFVRFVEERGKVNLFQYTYGMPSYYPQDIAFTNHLVVIGENLDRKKIHSQLNNLENIYLNN
ncbi:GTP-binding protein [Bacillus sp. SD075]|uniref:CobW family GTP-binding protein n=1 Tax=Bacillus sp. SD075 TaxID=2781732 RepID=UPI001A96B961|nr:GTP-binding protein [Bacillus sp. SD075]MBO0997487.1 GTP-binding protein [Bacillus sp. SD075]